MACDTGQQTDIENAFLNAVVHPTIRVKSTNFGLLALHLSIPSGGGTGVLPVAGCLRTRGAAIAPLEAAIQRFHLEVDQCWLVSWIWGRHGGLRECLLLLSISHGH